jgi:carbon monoxide dehydrogenase subunit G
VVDVERKITVRTSVEAVVGYLKDFANAEQWDPGTVSCVRIDGDDQPIGVGAHWHNVSNFRGRQTELDYRLDRLEARRVVFVGTNRTATSTDDLTVTEGTDGTVITYHANIVFHGLAKLADPFLRREFDRLGDEVVHTMTTALTALES